MEVNDFLEFGPFRADVRRKGLTRNGESVPLPAKAFDVLYALLQKPGQTVPKDELMKEVWPDTFVEEGNLTQMVFLLRKTLGETDGGQPFIVTMPRQGYRFVGNVTKVTPKEGLAPAPREQPTPSAMMAARRGVLPWVVAGTLPLKPGLKNIWWIGAAVAIVAAFGGWVIARYRVREPLTESRLSRFMIAPPENTSYRGGKVSPDGRWLALMGFETSGKQQLWVRSLDSLPLNLWAVPNSIRSGPPTAGSSPIARMGS
jgi:DNA-binding winged helix-turn-helix (wHTH) protein